MQCRHSLPARDNFIVSRSLAFKRNSIFSLQKMQQMLSACSINSLLFFFNKFRFPCMHCTSPETTVNCNLHSTSDLCDMLKCIVCFLMHPWPTGENGRAWKCMIVYNTCKKSHTTWMESCPVYRLPMTKKKKVCGPELDILWTRGEIAVLRGHRWEPIRTL